MATARLSDYDKGKIIRNFNVILNQVTNNKEFPIADEDMMAWGIRQMPKDLRIPYKYLMEHANHLVKTATYNASFYISSDNYKYEVSHYATWPCKNITIKVTDPLHKDVLEWVEWYYDMLKKIQAANRYQHGAIHSCTSAGQITRILPPEVIRFLPNKISTTLGDAERKSRIPRGFHHDENELENLLQMLALGSLSPTDHVGLNVAVPRRTTIAELE